MFINNIIVSYKSYFSQIFNKLLLSSILLYTSNTQSVLSCQSIILSDVTGDTPCVISSQNVVPLNVIEEAPFSKYTKRNIQKLTTITLNKIDILYNDLHLNFNKSYFIEGQFDMTLNLYKNRDEVYKELRRYLDNKEHYYAYAVVQKETDGNSITILFKNEKHLMFVDALETLGLLRSNIRKAMGEILISHDFPGAKLKFQ